MLKQFSISISDNFHSGLYTRNISSNSRRGYAHTHLSSLLYLARWSRAGRISLIYNSSRAEFSRADSPNERPSLSPLSIFPDSSRLMCFTIGRLFYCPTHSVCWIGLGVNDIGRWYCRLTVFICLNASRIDLGGWGVQGDVWKFLLLSDSVDVDIWLYNICLFYSFHQN